MTSNYDWSRTPYMTTDRPKRIPTRFVLIRNLVSPASAHLNGALARLGGFLPECRRFRCTPCRSDMKGQDYPQANVKEANTVDASDDDIVSYVLERLDDVSQSRRGVGRNRS